MKSKKQQRLIQWTIMGCILILFLLMLLYINVSDRSQNGQLPLFQDFILSISASVFASFIFVTILSFVSEKARWLITNLLGVLAHEKIEFVYSNKDSAKPDIKQEILNSSKVWVLTSRGNDFKRDTFNSLFSERREERKVDFRIILPKTNSLLDSETDWVEKRECEMAKINSAFAQGNKLIKSDIQANVSFIKGFLHKHEGTVLKRASFPHFARIIITDDYLYYTPYNQKREIDPVIKYGKGHMYKSFYRYFDLLWQNSTNDEST